MLLTLNCSQLQTLTSSYVIQEYQAAAWSSHVGKQVTGCAGWWVMPSPLVPLQGYTNGQGCPQQGTPMETIPSGPLCWDSQLRQICLVCLLLVITLTKPFHQGFSPLVTDSSASNGGRQWQMWLMGSCCICCTQGLACSAPSASG